MYSRIREQFSTSALILSIIALVLAATGGAYAAKQAGLNAKQKKEVTKIAQTFQGSGPAGATGTQGPAGPKGDPGAAGSPGTPGTPGKSVAVDPIDLGESECGGRGGALVGVAGEPGTNKEVCNGQDGQPGPEGSPWTDNGALPPEATEGGAWAFNATEATGFVLVPISFSIPLKESIFEGEGRVHFQTDPNFSTKCKGSVAEPNPEPGQLCVYGTVSEASFAFIEDTAGGGEGAGTTGALVRFNITGEPASGHGSFAYEEVAATP